MPTVHSASHAATEDVRDNASSTSPFTSDPIASGSRAPYRSTTGPAAIPAKPDTSTTPEKPAASAARLQPSSCATGSSSSAYRYWFVPYARIVVTPSATTIVQP